MELRSLFIPMRYGKNLYAGDVNSKQPPMGPSPALPPPAELSSSLRATLQVISQLDAPATINQIAAVAGGHPNTTRLHVEELLTAGLVADSRDTPAGRGRPAVRYAITPHGRSALSQSGEIDHRALTLAVAQQIIADGDAETVEKIGALWAQALSTTATTDATTPIEDLVQLFASTGFAVDIAADGESVLLHTCPMISSDDADPQQVCAMHRAWLAGAARSWGESASVELEPFAGPGFCRASLRQ